MDPHLRLEEANNFLFHSFRLSTLLKSPATEHSDLHFLVLVIRLFVFLLRLTDKDKVRSERSR